MRVRTLGAFSLGESIKVYQWDYSCAAPTVPTLISTTPGPSVGRVKTTWDVVTPYYWKRKKAGEMIFNPFKSITTTRDYSPSAGRINTSVANSCAAPIKHAKTQITGPQLAVNIRPAIVPNLISDTRYANLVSETITACFADRGKGSANYFESLGEADKTFRMLLNPLENVVAFLKRFPRGTRKNKIRRRLIGGKLALTFAASEYLRFRYGLSPLIADIQAAVKAMKKGHPDAPIRVSSRAHRDIEVPDYQTLFFSFGDIYGSGMTYYVTRRDSLSVRAVWYDSYQPSVLRDLGFSSQNLLGVWWEFTKYSFVVDWFANIGDFIYANLPRVGVVPLGGTYTVKRTQREVVSPGFITQNDPSYVMQGGITDTNYVSQDTLAREVLSEVDQLRHPVINADFRLDHWTRAADAAALVTQLLSRISFGPNRSFRANPDFMPSIQWPN